MVGLKSFQRKTSLPLKLLRKGELSNDIFAFLVIKESLAKIAVV